MLRTCRALTEKNTILYTSIKCELLNIKAVYVHFLNQNIVTNYKIYHRERAKALNSKKKNFDVLAFIFKDS